MELHLNIIGYLLALLALLHLSFPRYFNWKSDLNNLVLINRQMMYVHTFFIALAVLLTGVLCITSAPELVQTKLGNKLAFGLFIFWSLRLITQFVGYSAQLWKGKRFETFVHVAFSFLCLYVSAVFFITYWSSRQL